MILNDKKYVDVMSKILEDINYIFVLKSIRGGSDFVDPWYNFEVMEQMIEKLNIPYKNAIKLLYLGKRADFEELADEIGKEYIENMIESKIWYLESHYVKTNNLVVLIYEGLKLLTEINPWYTTCVKCNTDVYIGIDSLRLAENIVFDKDTTVLDLCSGTGIQGMIAARSAKKVISVEINEKAAKVTQFNISLNKLDKIMELRIGNLYDVLKQDKFDYIYANPPFIPMTPEVEYPICGAGGEDGLEILNSIFENMENYLKPNGQAIIFCQCLGDEENIFFNHRLEYLSKEQGWNIICLVQDKIPLEYQVRTLTSLTKLFNPTLNEDDFMNKMIGIYTKLNAKNLFSILYQIKKGSKQNVNFQILNLYNHWDTDSKAMIIKEVNLKPDDDSFIIFDKETKIGYFDGEALDIFNQLKKGKTVKEIADLLYLKYKDKKKYIRFGKPSFECGILDNCLKMEQLGIIQKQD